MNLRAGLAGCLSALLTPVLVGCGGLHATAQRSPLEDDSVREQKLAEAAGRAWVGDLDQARAAVAVLLVDEPDDAKALFVHACLALEKADLAVADEAVSRLRTIAPGPETAILTSLLESRGRAPNASWRDSYVRAWRQAGSPDLHASKLLVAPDLPAGPDEDSIWAAAEERDRLWLVLSQSVPPTAWRTWLLEQLPRISNLATACSAYSRLGSGDAERTLKSSLDRAERVRAHAERMATRFPDAIQPRLVALLFGGDREAPLSEQELAVIEEVSKLARYADQDSSHVFFETRRRLRKLGLENVDGRAFTAFVNSVDCSEYYLLYKRAEASHPKMSAEDQHRLGSALSRIGAARLREPTVLGRLYAHMLEKRGAEYSGHREEAAAARRELEYMRALSRASDAANVDGWPIPSLGKEWAEHSARNEVSHLAALVDDASSVTSERPGEDP